jgi:hypothetical protein
MMLAFVMRVPGLNPGMTRASIEKIMDCRAKPGNDGAS